MLKIIALSYLLIYFFGLHISSGSPIISNVTEGHKFYKIRQKRSLAYFIEERLTDEGKIYGNICST
jgi:hypothetical protein